MHPPSRAGYLWGITLKTGTMPLSQDVSFRHAARWAGLSLLLMAVLAGFAYGYVLQGLSPAEIPANQGLFRLGLLAWLLIFGLDVLVSWALYEFFRDTHPAFARLTAWLRLLYTALLGAAITHLAAVLPALAAGLDTAYLSALIGAFEQGWGLGLIVFGLHLLGLSWLSFRRVAVPNWLGWLLLIAGLGYPLVHLGKLLLPAYGAEVAMVENILALPMAAGELALAIWLLVRGRGAVAASATAPAAAA